MGDDAIPDYYAVLGVAREAEADEIKRAYRALAGRHHPDRAGQRPDAAATFQTIATAYAVLGHPDRRAKYDAGALPEALTIEPGGAVAEAVSGIVDRLFGVRTKGAARGRNRRYRLSVPFVDAMLGTSQTLTLPTQAPCSACETRGYAAGALPEVCSRCHGEGVLMTRPLLRAQVAPCPDCDRRGYAFDEPCRACEGAGFVPRERTLDIPLPASLTSGTVLRVRGEGEAGVLDGGPGDLLVEVCVAAHPHLRQVGDDIHGTRPVTLLEAILGGPIAVHTLEGPQTIKLPSGTRDRDVLRLVGGGARRADGTHGDLLTTVAVELPTRMSPEAQDAMRAFADAVPAEAFPETTRYLRELAS